MQTSPNGRKLIQLFEQFRPLPYLDEGNKGVWTVGFGHALVDVNGRQITDSALVRDAMMRTFDATTITRTQADAQMGKDLAPAEHFVPQDATQGQFDAMASFAFNAGSGNFLKSSVRRLHLAGQRSVPPVKLGDLCTDSKTDTSAPNIGIAFALWSKDNGEWKLGLFRRRAAELLVYCGTDAQTAFNDVEAFNG